MKTLILGIGNEIKRDDAVGLIAARTISEKINDVDVDEASSGGLPILDKIEGYDKVFIIDSVMTEDGKPGDCYYLTLEDLEGGSNRIDSHSIDLKTMKKMGEEIGKKMPEIHIFAIEVKELYQFGTELTEEVEEALPQIISEILETVEKEISE